MSPDDATDHAALSQVDPAPTWEPGIGAQHYLPDEAYFIDQPHASGSDEWFNSAVRAVVECALQFADTYEAAPVPASPGRANPQDRMERRGPVPQDPSERSLFCSDLLDWLEAPEGTLALATLNLYRGDRRLMVRSLGLPGTLACTPDEFAAMQACWEEHGFPRDLYYPASEQKTVIDPIRYMGSIVLKLRRYSAVRWHNRREGDIEALRAHIPSEVEREARFAEACKDFEQALYLRIAEMEEPGKISDREKVRALRHLIRSVRAAARSDAEPAAQPNEVPGSE